MSAGNSGKLTGLLQQASQGDPAALEQLLQVIYPELHRIAAKRLRAENPGHTLQPTALVNELYLRLFVGAQISWQNRAHFFAIVAKHMRFILVEHARHKQRGDTHFTVSLDSGDDSEAFQIPINSHEDLVTLDEVLQQFEAVNPRAARGVELRFFVGLTQQEIAEIQAVDVTTIKRDWTFAKAWLHSRLQP